MPPPTDTTLAPPGAPARLVVVNIEDEMRASYLDYAMSVIIGRALPDVRDGLKPVHRRVLFAMQDLGNTYNRAYKKSARVVGDVIGKYHPHGDTAVYDSLVRMAQNFSMRHLLVDGQGNFGSVDGDRPAAMRYTEVRMSKLAAEMLADLDKETVDFAPNYDASLAEPKVLPARFPNLLVNGSSGIAVGMATNIPPHNLAEVLNAAMALLRNPQLGSAELMQYMPGPDFPTGGILYGTDGLARAYETGRGSVQVRGRIDIEAGQRTERLVVTEIPYQLNKTSLIEKIAGLVRDKRLEGIGDIRDESDRDGMRVVIELKREAHGEVVLNQLYQLTPLQTTFGYNMVAIVAGQPRVLALHEMLGHFLAHRRDVVTRRCRFELAEAHKRFTVVFGLLAAIDCIDRIIALIRAAPDHEAARASLLREELPMRPHFAALCRRLLTFDFFQGTQALAQGSLHLNDVQAQAILDMRLARLTGLEQDKLAGEAQARQADIERLTAILGSRALLADVITAELEAVKKEYSSARRTQIMQDGRALSIEDLVANEAMVVTLSHEGYIKRSPLDLYQAQRRGGRGKTAATTREQDFVESVFVAPAHASVLIFTDRGKVYWLKVHKIPKVGRTSRGKPIVNLIRIEANERIAAVLPVQAFVEDAAIVMCTAFGYIKKTDLMAFSHPRQAGLKALEIGEGDRLIQVAVADGDKDIFLATRRGQCIRFHQSAFRTSGRSSRGVTGIRFKHADDAVVGMVVLDPALTQMELLTVCDNGYGKRTPVADYPKKGRGGFGTINIGVGGAGSHVAGIALVQATTEVMVVTHGGMMIRFAAAQVRCMGRGGKGVRVISLAAEQTVASLACLPEDGEGANPGDGTEAEGEADTAGSGDTVFSAQYAGPPSQDGHTLDSADEDNENDEDDEDDNDDSDDDPDGAAAG